MTFKWESVHFWIVLSRYYLQRTSYDVLYDVLSLERVIESDRDEDGWLARENATK